MKTATLLLALCMSFLMACSEDPLPPQLDRAMQTAEQMTSEGWLERSTFFVVFPEGTPKQYVSFLFSDLGAAERPPAEGSGELASDEEHSMRQAFMPVWPAGVGMTHSKPDPNLTFQVVWKWDSDRRMIILEAYADPQSPLLEVRETPFPTFVHPSDLARIAGESNLETGARAQSFR